MRRYLPAVLAWSLWLMDVTAILASAYLFTTAAARLHVAQSAVLSNVALAVAFLGFSTLGALIVSLRPGHRVGWFFGAIGLGTALTTLSAGTVQYALATGNDARLAIRLIDLGGDVLWPYNLLAIVFLLLLFPNGYLPSRRWRLAVWLATIDATLAVACNALTPGPLESGNRVINPLGIPGAGSLLGAVNEASTSLLLPIALAAVGSVIIRYRRNRGEQRQQIKWFAFGAALGLSIILVSTLVDRDNGALSSFGFALGIFMLPLGAGIGILRYRLYDIDVLVNRTLVYGSLTAVLAAIYVGGIIGLQAAVSRLTQTRQAERSPLILVVTTLLIAALFQPLRRRIQALIDRRFYRTRFDARHTLETFGASLRQEVDLPMVTASLLAAVQRTMQPAHVSLWLRPEGDGGRTHSPALHGGAAATGAGAAAGGALPVGGAAR
jgi:hypothetical protein